MQTSREARKRHSRGVLGGEGPSKKLCFERFEQHIQMPSQMDAIVLEFLRLRWILHGFCWYFDPSCAGTLIGNYKKEALATPTTCLQLHRSTGAPGLPGLPGLPGFDVHSAPSSPDLSLPLRARFPYCTRLAQHKLPQTTTSNAAKEQLIGSLCI